MAFFRSGVQLSKGASVGQGQEGDVLVVPIPIVPVVISSSLLEGAIEGIPLVASLFVEGVAFPTEGTELFSSFLLLTILFSAFLILPSTSTPSNFITSL